MSPATLLPTAAHAAGYVVWALVNGERRAHAHVRSLPHAQELRIVVDGRTTASHVVPVRLGHLLPAAADAQREQFIARGWSALAYGFVRRHANGVQARVSRDVFGGEWTASISLGQASVAPAGYWSERAMAQQAADATAHPGCGGGDCGHWCPDAA